MCKAMMALVVALAIAGCGEPKDVGYAPIPVRDCDDTDGTVSSAQQCGDSEEEFAPVLCSRPDSTRVAGCAVHLTNGRTAQPWTMACVAACPN